MQRKIHWPILVTIIFMISLINVPTMKAQEHISEFELVDQFGGTVSAVAIEGSHAYMGIGRRLVVVDLSEATHIQYVGSSHLFDDLIYEIKIRDGYAYTATGSSGLHIIDISTPSEPQTVAHYQSVGFTHSIDLSGDYAYLANNTGGLHILNIALPTSP